MNYNNIIKMFVIKRRSDSDGNTIKEPIHFDKITNRINKLINKNEKGRIDATFITQKVINNIYSGITTEEIDIESANVCANLATTDYLYSQLAGRILVSNLHKKTLNSFVDKMNKINDELPGLLHQKWLKWVNNNKVELENAINYNNDFNYDFFGFKTLERAYLIKNQKTKYIYERPQDVLMRVASFINMGDVKATIDCYNQMSSKNYTHATPTLFNSGTKRPQLSSCFLLNTNDSIEGITHTWDRVSRISKWAGGIGLHVSNIRSKGSQIRGTNGHSDGIIPMLQVYNSIARYVNQCFTPDTPIFTDNGFVNIENIKVNDKVMTSDGTYRNVNKIFINEVDKDIYKIRTKQSYEYLKCTAEHDILVYSEIPLGLNFKNIKYRITNGIYKPEYKKSSDLKKGDYMVIPKIKLDKDTLLTNDDYYFLGLFLGDGHLTKKKNSNSIECGITLSNITKVDCQIFVKNYLNQKNINFWEYKYETNCTKIGWTYSDKLFFKYEDIYNQEKEKILSSNFITGNCDKLFKLLKGLLDSDGHIGKEIYYYTTSKQLADSIRYILLLLNIPSSGNIKNNIGKVSTYKNITTRKISYCLRIPKVKKIMDLYNKTDIYQRLSYLELEDKFLIRIINIEKENYKGKVYDLNIEENHNYLTTSGIVHNSGKRKGSIAIYLEPHHPDIFEFLELRKNTGSELDRARDLFLALWVSDLFMECVRDDKDWYLMDPDECPNLNEVYGDEYKQLYQKYVDENKYRRVVKARDLMEKIMESQLETGVPYISYKDSVNQKSNQKNIGTIKSSNLCVAGDTLLKTFEGDFPIKTLENQNVKVWNGVEWSDTIVKKTGENKQLRKITFKLQSIKPIPQQQSNITRISLLRMTVSETYVTLYCTDYHKFYILDELKKEKEIRAFELQPGHKLYQFKNYNDENNMINTKPLVEVISNEITDRYEDVYCVNEPLRHRAVFNGILTGNCNEIVEVSNNEEHAVCNLASIAVNQFLVPFKSRRQWTIYTKENCQYCKWAKTYFDNKGFKYTEKTEIDDEVRKVAQKSMECDGDTCTLGKITLPQIFYGKQYIGGFEEMVKYTADDYDFNALGECAYIATKNLDRVIDVNYYPTPETKCSNMRNRPIGLGIQGLADTLAKMKINFDSDEAVQFNSKMMEYIYYYSLKASNDIAKSRYEMAKKMRDGLVQDFCIPEYYDKDLDFTKEPYQCYTGKTNEYIENEYYHQLRLTKREFNMPKYLGAYSSYEGSPMSQGLFQFDMWDNKTNGLNLSEELDWEGLRKSIGEYGVRNSLLTALMPTASTSQILGNNECFEWFTNNIYSRNTLAGNFPVVNRHLMEDMISIGEWNDDVKNIIIASDGSVVNVPNMPNVYRNLYKTIWEIKQIWVLKNARARAPFVDQTQSMNIFMPKPDYKKLNSCHMWGWKNGLKTGMYYLRSKAAAEAIKFTVDPKLLNKLQVVEEEDCVACSA